MQPATQTYTRLHFDDYLTGGAHKLAYLDWGLLRGDLAPLIAHHYNKPKALKPKRQLTKPYHDPQLLQSYNTLCQQLINKSVIALEFPGGFYRSTLRLLLDDGNSVIATRRLDASRSRYEALVLQRLARHSAPIPQLYAYNGVVMLQEDLVGQRLSDVLFNASEAEYLQWIDAALNALNQVHLYADYEQLHASTPIIGCEHEWLISLIDRTAVLGHYFNLPCPTVPVQALYHQLQLLHPRFVKWDARPGNAILHNGQVSWFDWEHCGARMPCDDMVWLLCDETVPDYPEAENCLIDTWLDNFAGNVPNQIAYEYLRAFGVHHSCVRLTRILDDKGGQSWAEYEERLGLKQGRLARMAKRLCVRAARWAEQNPLTKPLQSWLLELADLVDK
ncbi:MAG: hypothetical protein WAQ53_01120 [Thiofilum sp.]|uniref:hypothetical protein n=1 Tax=Thiofilum sp. TaxID=2212733 RepID=UPI0025E308DF|nr:hypothetical protein [Thiofilum sp.]MBK8455517.1 hypothetical protein [Thiofilum sp.]